MKIALVAQHSTPVPTATATAAAATGDDARLVEMSRSLAGEGHQVTVYARRNGKALPERAHLAPGVSASSTSGRRIPAAATRSLVAQVGAFGAPLRQVWAKDRPDVVHAVRWTSGLAALSAARDLRACPSCRRSTSSASPSAATASSRPGRDRADPPRARHRPHRRRRRRQQLRRGDRPDPPRHPPPRRSGSSPSASTPPSSPPTAPPTRATAGTAWSPSPTSPPRATPSPSCSRRWPRSPAPSSSWPAAPPARTCAATSSYRRLAKLSDSLGLHGRVFFAGQVARPALPPLLRSADLMVNVNQHEAVRPHLHPGDGLRHPRRRGRQRRPPRRRSSTAPPASSSSPCAPPSSPRRSAPCSPTPCSSRPSASPPPTAPAPATPGTASPTRPSPSTTPPSPPSPLGLNESSYPGPDGQGRGTHQARKPPFSLSRAGARFLLLSLDTRGLAGPRVGFGAELRDRHVLVGDDGRLQVLGGHPDRLEQHRRHARFDCGSL